MGLNFLFQLFELLRYLRLLNLLFKYNFIPCSAYCYNRQCKNMLQCMYAHEGFMRTFKKNETKILIVLKKLVAISHKKYLPCLSCVWKKCVFKVKNVSLVSLHLFYYLSDILLLL